uniref:Galectin n=1 Tax=Gadus morhua TaxID=8049 RepID=A0A8C4ZBW2_GADMO
SGDWSLQEAQGRATEGRAMVSKFGILCFTKYLIWRKNNGHINEGLRVGKRLIVVGVVEPRPDSPRSCAGRVSGRWGAAERTAPFFPFIVHQPFRIEISCQQSQFQIFVDGQQLLSFGHRVPRLQDIDTLWIAGALRITKLG